MNTQEELSPVQRAFNKAGNSSKQYIAKVLDLSSLNRRVLYDGNALYSCTNLSSDKAPYLCPRKSRELITTLTTPYAIFSTPDNLVCVDGTDFKIRNSDGTWTSKGEVTASAKSMVEFNGKIVIFPDKKYYQYRPTESFAALGTGAVYPADGGVPDIDFITTYRNRIFGVKGSSIYGSKLGFADVWNLFSTPLTASDSWWTDVSSRGNFKAIACYNDQIVMFKPAKLHELTLRKPPFSVSDSVELGVVGENALAEVDSVLYFAAPDGIYTYTGGNPRKISYPLDEHIVTCVLGSDNKTLYCCLYNGTEYSLYTYSAEYGRWLEEDALNVIQFHCWDGYLYALCADGKLYKFGSGTETVSWSAETSNYTTKTFDKKEPMKINVRCKINSGSSMKIDISYDDGQYENIKSITTTGVNVYEIPLMVRRCDRLKLKLSGTGYAEVYDMQFIYVKGSDVNG